MSDDSEPLAMRVGLVMIFVVYSLVLIPFVLLIGIFGPRDET